MSEYLTTCEILAAFEYLEEAIEALNDSLDGMGDHESLTQRNRVRDRLQQFRRIIKALRKDYPQ